MFEGRFDCKLCKTTLNAVEIEDRGNEENPICYSCYPKAA